MAVFWVLLGVLAMFPAAVRAAQVTIDFESFPAPLFAYTDFAGGNEDGFTIMPMGSPIIQIGNLFNYQNPELNGKRLENSSSQLSSFSIVKTGGGNFQFQQLAAATSNGDAGGSPQLVKVEGFLGASSVAVDNFSVLLKAYFPAVNLAGKNIDRLVITIQSSVAQVPGTTAVDNIVIEDAPPGTIIIEKRTAPSCATGFTFTQNIDTSGNFNLDDGGSKTFASVAPGTYAVTEDAPVGGRLTGLSCDDPDSTGDLGTRTATIKLAAGETVTCTFTNSEDDYIVVEKVTDPPGGTGVGFTGGLGVFTLDDGGVKVSSVPTGIFTITEDPAPAWDLTSIECWVFPTNPEDPPSIVYGDTSTRSVTLQLPEAGQAAFCSFTNTQPGSLKVVNRTEGGDGTFEFTSQTLSPANFQLTTTSGTAERTFSNLVPGTYDVTENAPAGWTLISATCSDGSDPASISLTGGENVTCTFTNTPQPVPVPTLSQWGLIIFGALMVLTVWWHGRMRLSRRR
jgi:hypothetical protein